MSYAIIRTAKIKTWSGLTGAAKHQSRTVPPTNADESRSIVPILAPPTSQPEAVRRRIGNQTIRKNAVLAQEILCSASPDYFRPEAPEQYGYWQPERLRAWRIATVDYLVKTYGDRLISIYLHIDEATPHIHAIVVPIDERGKLNANAVFNPAACKRMQDEYARAVKHLGLRRGEEKSPAQHTAIRRWYGQKQAEEKKSIQENQIRANFIQRI